MNTERNREGENRDGDWGMRDNNTLIIIRSIGFEIMAVKLAVVQGC